MNILVAYESSGTVREAFRKLGHNAWSCDLQPADDGSNYHLQGDVEEWISDPVIKRWDLIIMHPPCTALCVSGNAHYGTGKPKHQQRIDAIEYTLRMFELAAETTTDQPSRQASLRTLGQPNAKRTKQVRAVSRSLED